MKSFAVLAATFAGAAMAQELPMPSGDCANLCINNMARIAETQLQCGSDDISCFCTRSNWAFGIRDCSRQACDAAQSADAVQWAYARCAGVAATASNTPDAIPILTSAVASATASGNGNNGGSSSNSNGADVTSTVAVIASSAASAASSATGAAGSAASSVRSSMTSMVSSAASEAASLTSSIMSDANSALSSLSSEASEIMASASSAISSATESAAESATGTNAEGSPSATRTEGAAPKVTGMSFAAGAGIAAWLLL